MPLNAGVESRTVLLHLREYRPRRYNRPGQADLVARLRGCVEDRESLGAIVEDGVLDLKTQEKKTKRNGALINAARRVPLGCLMCLERF